MKLKAQDPVGFRQHLVAAEGYLDLGMADEALRELDSIESGLGEDAHPLRLRCRALIGLREWVTCVRLATEAARMYPEEGEFFLHWAYALRKVRPGSGAGEVIEAAPEPLRRSGVLHYNLARFEAQDGNMERARGYLEEACRLNPVIALSARRDPALKSVWN
ncbi:MAG: hypothetical protein IT577_10595 [Verrucomicrobiae bacterium]|nr:hypothetical protein [Verrucomicrobiae bacterium]